MGVFVFLYTARTGFLCTSVVRVRRAPCWVESPEVPPPTSLCRTSESMFFLFAFVRYSTVHVRPQIQISAQGGEHLYLQVGDGLGGGGQGCRGHGAVEQRVGRVAARGVCRLPVRFQVVSQVLAGVLQLVLVQDDVKQFLHIKYFFLVCFNKLVLFF